MTYDDVAAEAEKLCLTSLGGFHPMAQDQAPEGCQTLILLGPKEPAFWPYFQRSDEFLDGRPDPLDRWSTRILGSLAETLEATALLPFGGPPYLPFYSWALKTNRTYMSPIKLLVHDQSGLFVSFRGALGFNERIELPSSVGESPCQECGAPCLSACPVDAFRGGNYDSLRCKTHIAGPDTEDCKNSGCAARRACPISQTFGRLSDQSQFHMKAFLI